MAFGRLNSFLGLFSIGEVGEKFLFDSDFVVFFKLFSIFLQLKLMLVLLTELVNDVFWNFRLSKLINRLVFVHFFTRVHHQFNILLANSIKLFLLYNGFTSDWCRGRRNLVKIGIEKLIVISYYFYLFFVAVQFWLNPACTTLYLLDSFFCLLHARRDWFFSWKSYRLLPWSVEKRWSWFEVGFVLVDQSRVL